jgi:hypothetical protein
MKNVSVIFCRIFSLFLVYAAFSASLMGIDSRKIPKTSSVTLASLPSEAEAKISAALGNTDSAYSVAGSKDHLTATNPRQKLSAAFTSSGIVLEHDSQRWQLSLKAFGRGDNLKNAASVAPEAVANRVEYRRGALTEWYVNGPVGLEQGFTLRTALMPAQSGFLTIALALPAGASAIVDRDRTGVILKSPIQSASLHYAGLSASDAIGKALPAWIELKKNQLLLHVDDHNARYPVVIDPIFEQVAEFQSPHPDYEDNFGYSVAVSADGNTIAVGDTMVTLNAEPGEGEVFVFVKPASGWANMAPTAVLTASDGTKDALFGYSVAIDGDTIVVGADQQTVNGVADTGEAYVFVKPSTGWADMTETATLLAKNPNCSGGECNLGNSVAISGNTVVAGAFQAKGSISESGVAYVFVEPTGGWSNMTETAELTASDANSYAYFGRSVGISDNTIVVGASGQAYNGRNSGAVYVFVEPTGGWADMTETAELTSSKQKADQYLGTAVAIAGNTIAASAPFEGTGVILMYVEPEGGWVNGTENADLSTTCGPATQFGEALTFDGTMLGSSCYATGPEYVFVKPSTGWATTSTANFHLNAGPADNYFGWRAAIEGQTIVVGAPTLPWGPGSVYVFLHSAGN